MTKDSQLSDLQSQQEDDDVRVEREEFKRDQMEILLAKEAKRADVIMLFCALTLFVVVIFIFILCFETWAVDSPTGFWIWSKRWWGL